MMEAVAWLMLCMLAGIGFYGVFKLAARQLEQRRYEQYRWECDYDSRNKAHSR